MSNYQDQMMSLLQRAYDEGLAKASQSSPSQPSPADDIPVHNIVNPIVDYYFQLLPADGYKYSDVDRMWYFTKYVSESSRKNMADRSNPFLVFYRGGDRLLLESEGLPSQTILPQNNVYECYQLLPDRVYHWQVMKGNIILKKGEFKTIGFIRLINIPTWPNLRDIAYTPIMRVDRVLSGANPDNVVVGSDDYKLIQSLGIDFQLNLRKPDEKSDTENPWRPDLFPAGCDNNLNDYSSALTNPTGWKSAIEIILRELQAGHRIAINCFAGADRTGSLRYVLQGICGVPKHIAQGFYGVTSIMYWLNTKMWDKVGTSGKEDQLRRFDQDLEKAFGPDYFTQCYLFLTQTVGITSAQIKALQMELMVDPATAPTPILPS